MSVFRQRRVFRDFGDTRPIGSASVVAASVVAASIVFAGSATGATTATDAGSVSGSIVIGGGSISQASMEVSCSGSIVFGGGSVTGLGISTRSASGSIVFAGVARPAALASGSIAFGGSATVGSTFTMDASGAIVFGGTVNGIHIAPTTAGTILFGGTIGTPVVTDGTISAATMPASIIFDGSASGTSANIVQGPIEFGGVASGDRVGTTRPIDRILVSVEEIYQIGITVEIRGA